MATIIVLGGAGAVGSVAVKNLVKSGDFTSIIIGDYNLAAAEALADDIDTPEVSARFVDALNPAGIREALDGCDIVLNCVGPFYRTVKPILAAVLEKRINYVDICDDVDVTLEILDMDLAVKQRGIQVLLGMGNSPGITNMLGKLAADLLLDETESIDIFHTHGGEKIEGEGVIAHRFHCMTIPCPMFLDGKLVYVNYFAEDGKALRQTFDFPVIGKTRIYPYPHPEQVTLPRHINLRRVTNKGSVIPEVYYDLTRDLCGLGFNSRNPISVKGQMVTPYDVAVAYILKERERMIAEAGLKKPRGCVSVIAKGKKGGRYKEYRFHLLSESEGLGEGTGIPAAVGAVMMKRGLVCGTGVLPPEAGVAPLDFLKTTGEIYDLSGKGGGDAESRGRILLETVDENGTVSPIDISQFGIF